MAMDPKEAQKLQDNKYLQNLQMKLGTLVCGEPN